MANAEKYRRWEKSIKKTRVTVSRKLLVLGVILGIAAGASAVVLLKRGGPVRNATATVRLHDAETINLSDYENLITSYVPGASLDVSGTFTVNTFSVTNVAVRLHNKTADEWITIVEGQTINDMTENNDFSAPISSGTYDKVSFSIGAMTLDVSWSEITFSFTNFPGIPDNSFIVPASGYIGSLVANKTFELSLAAEVVVTEGANQVFDVDIGAPFSPLGVLYGLKMQEESGENYPIVNENSIDAANMSARGL